MEPRHQPWFDVSVDSCCGPTTPARFESIQTRSNGPEKPLLKRYHVMNSIRTSTGWALLPLGFFSLSLISALGASPGQGPIPTTSVNRYPIDLDGDGTSELEWVETLFRSPNPPPLSGGVDWSRELTLVPREGVFIQAESGTAEPSLVRWVDPRNPQGEFPGDTTQWSPRPVFVSSVVQATFSAPPVFIPTSVVTGTIAHRVPTREEPYHLRVRIGSGAEERHGWVAIGFRDLGGGFPERGPGNLEVRLRGFGLGQPGEPPSVGVGNRFRPVRFERGEAGPRLVLDTLALWNGVEAAPSLGSTNWTTVTSAETIDPSVSARFFRFSR